MTALLLTLAQRAEVSDHPAPFRLFLAALALIVLAACWGSYRKSQERSELQRIRKALERDRPR